jgi:predicted nucleic-acid-binding protein
VSELHSIDANVILRYVMHDDPKLFAKAYAILRAVQSGQTVVTCDPVNLADAIWMLSRDYKLSNQQICDGLEPIFQSEGFLMPDKERYLLAFRLFKEGLKSFGDACICAAALQDCEGRLFSFDVDLSKVPGVTRSESP